MDEPTVTRDAISDRGRRIVALSDRARLEIVDATSMANDVDGVVARVLAAEAELTADVPLPLVYLA